MNSYPLLDSAEKLIADTRKTSKQSRKLIDATNEQILLSHKILAEAFKKPYVLKAYIEKAKNESQQ